MLQKKTYWTVLIAAGLLMASPAVLATTSSTTLPAGQTAQCDQSGVNAAANSIYQQAQNNYQTLVPQPSNIAQSSCFSNILNMGSSIGLSFFSAANLIQQLQQMVCNAAQQALQWPMQQASNTVNQYGQVPYGMGGVSMSPGGNGFSVNQFSSSGPSVNGIPTGGGNVLGNTLGNALGG